MTLVSPSSSWYRLGNELQDSRMMERWPPGHGWDPASWKLSTHHNHTVTRWWFVPGLAPRFREKASEVHRAGFTWVKSLEQHIFPQMSLQSGKTSTWTRISKLMPFTDGSNTGTWKAYKFWLIHKVEPHPLVGLVPGPHKQNKELF